MGTIHYPNVGETGRTVAHGQVTAIHIPYAGRTTRPAPAPYAAPHVLLVLKSANVKTGPIACTYTESTTCPTSCPLNRHAGGIGCYAQLGMRTRAAWQRADGIGAGPNVHDWASFCARVAVLPAGSMLRHNVAGDLPGAADVVDAAALRMLTRAIAAAGVVAWSYTHKPVAAGPTCTSSTAARNAAATGL